MARDSDREIEMRAAGPTVWTRQRVLISLLLGIGSVALGWVSWLFLSAPRRRGYQVVAQWPVPRGGKGLIVAVSPDPSRENLRRLGERLRDEFGHLDDAVVMVFDNAEAARLVSRGSRIVGVERFGTAIPYQRARYIKSRPRGEHSFTIYDAYPRPREVIRYGAAHLRERTK